MCKRDTLYQNKHQDQTKIEVTSNKLSIWCKEKSHAYNNYLADILGVGWGEGNENSGFTPKKKKKKKKINLLKNRIKMKRFKEGQPDGYQMITRHTAVLRRC